MTEEQLAHIESKLSSYQRLQLIGVGVSAIAEIRRLRAELDAERTKHQELWRLVDRELDRIYCEAKGVEQ